MRIMLRIFGLLRNYWLLVVLAHICLLGSIALSMATPWLIKEAIDIGIVQQDMGFLIFAGLAIVAVHALHGGVGYGENYILTYISQRVAYDLRNALYDALQRLSFSYHDRAQTGQLMSRATADVAGVNMFVRMGIVRIGELVVRFVATTFILITMNWRLALISFVCLPFIGYLAIATSRRLQPTWMGVQRELANLGAILQENLTGVRVVRIFGQEAREGQKFAHRAKELYNLQLRTARIQAFNMPLMSFALAASLGLILWYGGREVIMGHLTVGELVAFNSYVAMLAMPIRMMGGLVNQASRAFSAGQRVFEVLDAPSEVREKPDATELAGVQGHVRFDKVSFSYDSVSPVLKDVTFKAQPGQMVALLGTAGSGKSTVVNLVPRFYEVTTGSISIDGVDIRDVTLASLRRNVGIVLQDTFLFSTTIRENIAYGKPSATEEEVIAAAKAARIHDFIVGLPQDYDTWVEERGMNLSGGQRQRLAIARTLLVDPRILILDDATSSVDVETEYQIQEALAELMKGRTTFVIAHRMATVKRADLILVLRDGEIMEQGRHEELMAKGGLYREIFELQIREQEAPEPAVAAAETQGGRRAGYGPRAGDGQRGRRFSSAEGTTDAPP